MTVRRSGLPGVSDESQRVVANALLAVALWDFRGAGRSIISLGPPAKDLIRWYQLSLRSLVKMVNKNHSPGGGKTICASVEGLLSNGLCNTTSSFQSELQNVKLAPELAIAKQQNCTGIGSQTFPYPASRVLQLPWISALCQNFALFSQDSDLLNH